jgi:hypothetical protein
MAPSKNYRVESFLWVTTDKIKGNFNASEGAAAKHYFSMICIFCGEAEIPKFRKNERIFEFYAILAW